VADHLLSPELFSGWGIRTLATTMSRYNPVSYHNGSVWPHDNALIVAGLIRYGLVDAAHRVIEAQLDASAAFGGRLPELFAGISRQQLPVPATYPASCSPQAWAAAAPLLLLRAMLRFDPWVSERRMYLSPVTVTGLTQLALRHVAVDGRRVSLQWHDGVLEVGGLDGIELVESPRPPSSQLYDASP
jgi:glycogen debranching enzyme